MMSSLSGGKRLVKSKSGLKIVCQHDRETPPWELAEPPWVADQEVLQCSLCGAKFDFIKRRHHCRRCGQIFCGKCCSTKVQFHRMGFIDPVRHCCNCASITKAEEEFFVDHIKCLFNGAPFHVQLSTPVSSPSTDENSLGPLGFESYPVNGKLYYLKLSSDQRSILFDPYDTTHDSDSSKSFSESVKSISPISISKISKIDLHQDEEDKKGLPIAITLHFKVTGEDDESQIKLESPAEPSRKPSLAFIAALRRGIQMVLESHKEPIENF